MITTGIKGLAAATAVAGALVLGGASSASAQVYGGAQALFGSDTDFGVGGRVLANIENANLDGGRGSADAWRGLVRVRPGVRRGAGAVRERHRFRSGGQGAYSAVAWQRPSRPWVDILPESATLGSMSTQEDSDRIALLQGTLDVLILRMLLTGPEHGQGIARAIQQQSGDVLLVDHGSLYPALQRLERKGWITADWGVSSNNRRARFYELTESGRAQLRKKTNEWQRLVAAMARVLSLEGV